MNISNWLS